MKDLSPIAEGDILLEQKEALGMRGVPVGLVSEELMVEKRRRYELCKPLARDILEEARAALSVRFRFMNRALWHMPLKPSFDIFGIATDGITFYYDPEYVVTRFKLSLNEVIRDVAHCVFHCVFRHPFMLYSVMRASWDTACDIAIESMLIDLLGEDFPSNMDSRNKRALRVIRAQAGGIITAERLYRFFTNEGSGTDLRSLGRMFFHDTHGLWYGDEEESQTSRDVASARQEVDDDRSMPAPNASGGIAPQLDTMMSAEDLEFEEEQESASGEGDGGSPADDAQSVDEPTQEELDEAAKQWEDMARDMQVELDSAISKQGSNAGSLIMGLEAVNREKHDYADFLKRFATLHERMRVNPDEFDYIYYTYGLDRYGNMPLIEPLEYKEDRAVSEFAIVIDTSESVSGDLVQAFVRKTYNILKQAGSFHERVNVHIIQCDARVQEDTKITSLDQLDLYLQNMELKGFGGTDFRPAFEYVNLLIQTHEFHDLRGLIYFTDGQGTFPRKPPPYDALFVFIDDGYSDPEVPPWAYKVLLDEAKLRVEEKDIRGTRATGTDTRRA